MLAPIMICCLVKCRKLGSSVIAVAIVVKGPRVTTVISPKNKKLGIKVLN